MPLPSLPVTRHIFYDVRQHQYFRTYVSYLITKVKNIFMCFYHFFLFCIWYNFLSMNEKQKTNLAKFFYDIAKIDFAALVVAQFANPSNLKYWILIVGIIATIIPILVGLVIDKQEAEK